MNTKIITGNSFILPTLGASGEPLHFLWVEPGSFLMGSPAERQFRATLSKGFWLSKNLVTQNQWHAVMNSNPSRFQGNGGERPVESVSWFEAMEFCGRLTSVADVLLPEGYSFSLPTEAQWEYACRAGTTTKYFFGESESETDRFAWHGGNSNGETHPVGSKEANPWGFHDMYGNVWQWCYDELATYPEGEATDWIGVKELNPPHLPLPDLRMVRGSGYGGMDGVPGISTSADRYEWRPYTKRPWCGFRLAIRTIT